MSHPLRQASPAPPAGNTAPATHRSPGSQYLRQPPRSRPHLRPVASAEDSEFFERQVRPVLANHCLECHGPKKQEAGLRLDSRAALTKGSDSGPVLVAGDPATGKLITAIGYGDENLQMPPDGKLPPEALAALAEWVKRGLPWPADAAEIAAAVDPDAWRRHWAFQPIGNPAEPAVRHDEWVSAPVDRFVLAKLEREGFEPSPLADRRTWLRRVSYDLIGLPPTAAGYCRAWMPTLRPGRQPGAWSIGC